MVMGGLHVEPVKDTVGVGDAFLTVIGLYAAMDALVEVRNFVGNIAGVLDDNMII